MGAKIVSIPMEFDRERFGLDCRRARLSADLTQREVGELIGMSGDFVSACERGYPGLLTVRTLELVANLWDLRPDHYWILRDGKPASEHENR